MDPGEVWERFKATGDIAWAGTMVYSMARKLKEEVISLLDGKKRAERVNQAKREVKLRGAKLIAIRARIPVRPPSLRDLITAFRWVEENVTRILSIPLARISKWNLHDEIARVREILLSLGRGEVSFFSLVRGRSEIAPTLISLLYLERQGEVELHQDRPFGDILIRVKSVDGGGEEAP